MKTTINTHDFEPMCITEAGLSATEEWADQGMLTANQVQMVMDKCAEIVKAMLADQDPNSIIGHMGKAEKRDRLIRSIATLDRLHEAVKLNSRRVNSRRVKGN